MARTVLASPTREVVIGFDQPFVMIGERINPTNRPKFAKELADGETPTQTFYIKNVIF